MDPVVEGVRGRQPETAFVVLKGPRPSAGLFSAPRRAAPGRGRRGRSPPVSVDALLYGTEISPHSARAPRGSTPRCRRRSPADLVVAADDPEHLPAYLDEMEFRFNNRENPYLFRDTLLVLVHGEALPYVELVSRSSGFPA